MTADSNEKRQEAPVVSNLYYLYSDSYFLCKTIYKHMPV